MLQFVPDSKNRYPTAYFRHAFSVPAATRVPLLRLGLLRDDGAIVYLNGKEIVRNNLPAEVTHATRALSTVEDEAESAYTDHMLDPRGLAAGTNYLAVEVHRARLTARTSASTCGLMFHHTRH